MVDRYGGFDGEYYEHPAAEVIRRFAPDAPHDEDMIKDVSMLVDAAGGPLVSGPHEALRAIAEIRRALAEAEKAASTLPEQLLDEMRSVAPEEHDVVKVIERARHILDRKLDHGERAASSLAERTRATKAGGTSKKARKEAAYRVASAAHAIFERRVGPATVKHKNKEPRSDFGRFVDALFAVLFRDPRTRPGWYDPAKWAVTAKSQNK